MLHDEGKKHFVSTFEILFEQNSLISYMQIGVIWRREFE